MPNFVIIGLATDGPSNVAYKPTNVADLKSMFGGDFRERFYLSPTATSISMQIEPFSMPLNEVDTKKQYLYAPSFRHPYRTIIDFGTLGGTAVHTVDLIYDPYKGRKDLLVSAQRFFDLTGEMPYVVRLGGRIATLSVSGWEFESKFGGNKYNSLAIHSLGSSMTIFGMDPNYPTKTYAYTVSSLNELKDNIFRDFELGISPVICTSVSTGMIPSGTYYFSGGTDGSFSDSDFDSLLNSFGLPISVDHVLVLASMSSGMISSISTSQSFGQQPRIFFIPSLAYATTGGAAAFINESVVQIPYRHNMAVSFVGNIFTTYKGEYLIRYGAEAAAIAYQKSKGFNLTNLPIAAEAFAPTFSEIDQALLKENGYVVFNRFIRNDIAIGEGTTTYGENSFLYSSKLAEIGSIIHSHCAQYYGLTLPDGPKPDIEKILTDKISSVRFITLQSLEVIKRRESLYVRVEAFLPDEILSISFTIQNK